MVVTPRCASCGTATPSAAGWAFLVAPAGVRHAFCSLRCLAEHVAALMRIVAEVDGLGTAARGAP